MNPFPLGIPRTGRWSGWFCAGCAIALMAASLGRAENAPNRPPAAQETAPPPVAYVLQNSDAIRVEVYQEPDLMTEGRIDAAGNLRMPLVSSVHLAGLTVPDAQRAIEKALRDGEFIRAAHVTIRVEAYTAREVMITGEVKSPGSYALPAESGMSVIELISKAGGFTDLARGNDVNITRIAPGGEKRTIVIPAAKILEGKGDAHASRLMLQAGDIVFVPERIF